MVGFEDELALSSAERTKSSVLVVEPDALDRTNLRNCLKSLGYRSVSEVSNHLHALERLEQAKFSHILFDSRPTNMPPKDFLRKVLEVAPKTICIPSSREPRLDDVFDLLVIGAKGYLVKPFTANTVDAAIVSASKGEPISEVVLKARDRNEALAAILVEALDKAATTMRQAQQFETAKRELPRQMAGLRRASDLAVTFCKDGEQGLLDALERFCIERSKGPATRLGRLRKRLHTKRGDEPVPSG
jgi:two-component system, chemotaxis family, chemotaxis protein CheY